MHCKNHNLLVTLNLGERWSFRRIHSHNDFLEVTTAISRRCNDHWFHFCLRWRQGHGWGPYNPRSSSVARLAREWEEQCLMYPSPSMCLSSAAWRRSESGTCRLGADSFVNPSLCGRTARGLRWNFYSSPGCSQEEAIALEMALVNWDPSAHSCNPDRFLVTRACPSTIADGASYHVDLAWSWTCQSTEHWLCEFREVAYQKSFCE